MNDCIIIVKEKVILNLRSICIHVIYTHGCVNRTTSVIVTNLGRKTESMKLAAQIRKTFGHILLGAHLGAVDCGIVESVAGKSDNLKRGGGHEV